MKNCKQSSVEIRKYMFIRPPSIDSLRERLEARGTETPESLELRYGAACCHDKLFIDEFDRLRNASSEIAECEKLDFDTVIVNDDLEKAYSQFKEAMADSIASVHDSVNAREDGAKAV